MNGLRRSTYADRPASGYGIITDGPICKGPPVTRAYSLPLSTLACLWPTSSKKLKARYECVGLVDAGRPITFGFQMAYQDELRSFGFDVLVQVMPDIL